MKLIEWVQVIDDVVDRESSLSPERKAEVERWFRDVVESRLATSAPPKPRLIDETSFGAICQRKFLA